MAYNGILNVYKEKGYTSHDVVAILRRVLKQKKIGHTGTLDPEATGVLPICLGKGTKVAGLLTDKDKIYQATMVLGEDRDTGDHTGSVVASKAPTVSVETLEEAIASFVGVIDQIPPMYSAIKIKGKKLYELAREGKEVERAPRQVHIFSITDVKVDYPRVTMRVHCSKGTYIRTLCEDIAHKAGEYGHMCALERVASGVFKLEESHGLEAIEAAVLEGKIGDWLTPIDAMFPAYGTLHVKGSYNKLLYNGNKLPREAVFAKDENEKLLDNSHYNVYNEENVYMGIYLYKEKAGLLVPTTFFDLRQ